MTARPGFVLLLSLALVMALSLLGLGMVAAGSREAVIGAVVQQRIEAQQLAEGAALLVFHEWSTQAVQELAVGERAFAPTEWVHGSALIRDAGSGDPTDLEIERVDSDLYLIHARSTVGGSGSTKAMGQAALLAQTIDPAWAAATFPVTIVARAVSLESGSMSFSDACSDSADVGAGLWAGQVIRLPGFEYTPTPPQVNAPVPEIAEPAPTELPLAEHLADLRVTVGLVAPRPVSEAGSCVAADGNWGAVSPTDPCFGHRPMILAEGGLKVTGGEGRGLLVVDGDLLLESEFRFQGLVRVHGTLTLADGAVIMGAVRADSLHISGGAIQHDGCAVLAAVASPALDRAFRPRHVWWVPAF